MLKQSGGPATLCSGRAALGAQCVPQQALREAQCARVEQSRAEAYPGGGGGISWHFSFAWEISCFKLTVKFPKRNSGFSANFLPTSSTHCGLWRGVTTQHPGGSAKFPTAKFTTANLTWRNAPPPPCSARAEWCLRHTGLGHSNGQGAMCSCRTVLAAQCAQAEHCFRQSALGWSTP